SKRKTVKQRMGEPAPSRAAPSSRLSKVFDPWNSSSTGHQRADRQPGSSTAWRASRNAKVNGQFHLGPSGGPRLSDAREPGSRHVGSGSRRSVADMLVRPGSMRQPETEGLGGAATAAATPAADGTSPTPSADKAIFSGVVVYVNGSTYPLISDHRLKHLLAENGGRLSLHLGRRTVTHVVLGRPNNASSSSSSSSPSGARGFGGGLAGGKMQREIARMAGSGVKYVGVEWILESIAAGKRLPEARFATTKIAPRTQGSVYDVCTKK
ncbi:BRCA1 C Terminus (BRCT) domain, partial [Geosmithia morbida]